MPFKLINPFKRILIFRATQIHASDIQGCELSTAPTPMKLEISLGFAPIMLFIFKDAKNITRVQGKKIKHWLRIT